MMLDMVERVHSSESGLTAARVAALLERARQEGKADISMSTFYRLVREGVVKKTLPGGRVQDALYDEAQVRDLIERGTPAKRKRRAKLKGQQRAVITTTGEQSHGATDWIQLSDLAYVYVLDSELYGVENSVSPTTTLTWWRKNPYACRILFNKDNRKDVWGALLLIPMEESTIYQLLSGELKEQDITADQVLAYEPGQRYSCYVASIAIRPEHRQSFAQLLHSVLAFWCEWYPDIQITSLYGFALNEEEGTGLRLIRKLYFAPRYDLGENAWELRLDRYNPSPVIQQFQRCLQQKPGLRGKGISLPPLIDGVMSEAADPFPMRGIVADAVYEDATRDDIAPCVAIDEAIFGEASTPIEQYIALRQRWWEQDHETFHVLRSKGQVVGYVSTLALPLNKIERILREREHPRDIKPEEIQRFQPGNVLYIYIVVMGVDTTFTMHQKRLLASKLINGLTETFQAWGRRGVNIDSIYARSRFEEGIRILTHIGFKETDFSPVNGKAIFSMNIAASDSPFAQVYKDAFEEFRQSH
jgi:hypothetical protein